MTQWPEYISPDGAVRLINADCLEVLPTLEAVDSLITDPPYGIDLDTDYSRFGDSVVAGRTYEPIRGDSEVLDLRHLFSIGKKQVVFGANNWPDQIPFNPKRDGWIVWDKRTNEEADAILGSPFEMAVVRGQRCYKFIRLQHCGVKHADGDRAGRFHPSQKPVALIERVLKIISCGESVCDPYMGSGTTALACIRKGIRFLGIEIDPVHYATAVRRVKAEYARTALIEEPQSQPLQQRELL